MKYQDGFGDMLTTGNNFWLGNKYQNLITNSDTYTLVIELADDSWNDIYQQEYSHFIVGDAVSLFKLDVSGTSSTTASGYPTPGDSFSSLNGNYFSTYDSDNDGNIENCANLFRGGFWYGSGNQCAICNLNGELINSPYNERLGVDYEVFWEHMALWSPWHVQMWLERR